MRIAIMGAGALGCYFGGRLAAAGEDVTFIARGAHLKAMQENGLRIESPLGDLTLPSVRATDDPAAVGPVDHVLFLVKLPDTRSAAEAMRPLLGPETTVLSLQNGVDAWGWIGEVVGMERVLAGTARIPAMVSSPGVVTHSAPTAQITFGEFDGSRSPRAEALLATYGRAVDTELIDDIEVEIWSKFVMLSAFSALTCMTRLPIGPIRETPPTRALLRRAAEETAAVGKAICPRLPAETVVDGTMAFFDKAPPIIRSSMLDDLNRGKPIEVEHLSGAVARLAAENGLSAPVHETAFATLVPFAKGPPALP